MLRQLQNAVAGPELRTDVTGLMLPNCYAAMIPRPRLERRRNGAEIGAGDAARFESTDPRYRRLTSAWILIPLIEHGPLQEGHSIAAEKWVGRNAGGTLRSSCFSSRSCLFISLVLQLRELLTNALDTNCECWSRGYALSKLFRPLLEVCCYYLPSIRFPCQSRIMELYF